MRQGLVIAVSAKPGITEKDLIDVLKGAYPETGEDKVCHFAIVDAVNDLAITEIKAYVPEHDPIKLYFPAGTRFET